MSTEIPPEELERIDRIIRSLGEEKMEPVEKPVTPEEVRNRYTDGTQAYNVLTIKDLLVEAAGVEPASENVTGQEPTYVVAFTRRELPRHIRFLRLEPTRNASR